MGLASDTNLESAITLMLQCCCNVSRFPIMLALLHQAATEVAGLRMDYKRNKQYNINQW